MCLIQVLAMKTLSVSLVALVCLFQAPVDSVDRSKFKTCHQATFCRRARSVEPGNSPYSVDISTVTASSTMVEAVLLNELNNVQFRLEIFGLKDQTFRFKLREAFPLSPRFEVPEVLVGDPEREELSVEGKSDAGFTVVLGHHKLVVGARPFKMDFYSDGVLVMTANARGLLKFEHYRIKKEKVEGEQAENTGVYEEPEEDGMWEESFSGTSDSKPKGPSAIAMDFTFVNTNDVYGIPEHADKFSLSDTTTGDPYRLYNLDVFEFEIWNPMALYAAIPFMIAHNKVRTTGLFWLNAAETWVDIKKDSTGVLSSISNFVGSGQSEPQVETHWISESGVMDVFILMGPKPKDVSRQYGKLTGNTPLPPQFSLAYHQCRWNYNDQEDVKTVAQNFDNYDIPMDVMWLDIEHTDNKKYFTWDDRKFPKPLEMVADLTAVGRKLVTIVDPHIKKESGYWVHKDLTDLGLYVKTKDGGDYEGWCWPGASYYPDFLNPEAREYFSEQYMLDNYKGSTLDVFTWNDMNEPSVFNGPEVTMPKDIVHYGGWEHRDLHNIYGHLYVMGTFEGHLKRSNNNLRPFILTRSAFAGTQKYAAIWTGDNTAEWKHLEASVPMCLSLSVAGMTFCGSDIGGFFNNPDGPLFVRWYQAAAFQPFIRSHSHIDTKRREPWLFSETELKRIREAVRWRYTYLPLWYTLFYEGEQNGTPPMRPLWYEFPEDEGSFKVDNEHMVGGALLVRTIYEQGVSGANVYFPGTNQIWYDIFTAQSFTTAGNVNVPVSEDRIPVYQRGGTIIPKKERIRRSSKLMINDPYTLIVALDVNASAQGTLYIDDGESFDYRSGKYIYIEFDYRDNQLVGHVKNTPIRGRVALVTGASAGIGVAISRQLSVDHGMKVVGCARRLDRLQKMEKEFEDLNKVSGSGGKFYGVECDLDKDESIRKMFDWIKNHPDLGHVDVCICNAGILNNEPLTVESSDTWRQILNVNVVAASLCAQISINTMLEKGIKDGQVIFINSIAGHKQMADAKFVFYNASKLALTCVVEGWRKTVQEVGDNKIRVSQVSPGGVLTEIFKTLKPDPSMPELTEEFITSMPLLTSEHIADAVIGQMSPHPDVQVRDTFINHVLEKMV